MATATLTRTDEQVQTDVLAELKWNAQVQPNEIGVAVKNGVVTLTGWVDSYLKKWSAEEAAHRVNGVKAVANDIEVRLPNSSERTDADIALAAVRALEWDAGVPSDKVKATVSKGWVTLRGEVEWQYQKLDAEQVELQQKIEDALVRSAQVDASKISVEVQGSVAILKGNVRAWVERREAVRAAWSAPGITWVENQITIET